MRRQLRCTSWDWAPQQTSRPRPIILNYFPRTNEMCLKLPETSKYQNKYFHNFEVGQCVLGFGERDGKMYYKIRKIYKKKFGTGPRVIVTLGPTAYSKGPMLWGPVLGSTTHMSWLHS